MIKSKKYKLSDTKKSVAGSVTMFAISTILIGGYLFYHHFLSYILYPINNNIHSVPSGTVILSVPLAEMASMCENKNKIEYTDFLDLAQIELVQNYIDKLKIENYMSYGGFEQAERKMFVNSSKIISMCVFSFQFIW